MHYDYLIDRLQIDRREKAFPRTFKKIYVIYKPHEGIPTVSFSWQDWSPQSPFLFSGEGKIHAESD